MKRLIVFIFLVVLFCVINIGAMQNLSLKDIFPNANCEVYFAKKTDLMSYEKLSNGEGEILFCNINDLNYIKQNKNICGYTIKIENQNIKDVLNKLCPSYSFVFDEYVYGYKIGAITCNVELNGKKVNFQCAQKENCVLIGFPILLGSY